MDTTTEQLKHAGQDEEAAEAAAGTATYCPEDDKIRLYIGHVPRDEYERLRAAGFKALHKQRDAGKGDFVATWSPNREDIALEYSGGILEDEDAGPQERAADRAERFAGYRNKREGEALQLADKYDSGPTVHGYQSAALAERRAAKHDMQATRAANTWDKAEYWQRRTAGVIAHALHKAAPGVRMGRIKKLESEIRGAEKTDKEAAERWQWVRGIAEDPAAAVLKYAPRCPRYYMGEAPPPETAAETFQRVAVTLAESITQHAGRIQHPRKPELSGYVGALMHPSEPDPLTLGDVCAWYISEYSDPAEAGEGRWLRHLRLRLEYENQMLEAQGGRLASVDIEPGGALGGALVVRVAKSPATGRVVSAFVKVPKKDGWDYRTRAGGKDYDLLQIQTERLKPESYQPPTPEGIAALAALKEEKKEASKAAPKAPPLINPTDEDAEKLQAVWNTHENARIYGEAKKPLPMTQADYSTISKGTYGSKPEEITGGGFISRASHMRDDFPTVARIRQHKGRVVILTDKPRKAYPAMWDDPRPAAEAEVVENWETLQGAAAARLEIPQEDKRLFRLACLTGYASSYNGRHLTEKGVSLIREKLGAGKIEGGQA